MLVLVNLSVSNITQKGMNGLGRFFFFFFFFFFLGGGEGGGVSWVVP